MFDCLHDMGDPVSAAQPGGHALGAQAGEAAIRQVVIDAGFTRFRRFTDVPSDLPYEWSCSDRPRRAG